MKAKIEGNWHQIIKDGDIVTVYPDIVVNDSEVFGDNQSRYLCEKDGFKVFIPTMFVSFEEDHTILLKPEKTIDWEERRYELVKGIISNIPSPTETDCDIVISIVDSLIKRLKDEKE